MGKYQPLTHYLNQLGRESWEAEFREIERVLGFTLPESAYSYPAWWANQDGAHSQTKGWRDAGWRTCDVNLSERRVRFVRSGTKHRSAAGPDLAALRRRAMELTQIDSPAELERRALECLIRHEAGKHLIAMGGTQPDAAAPPRRRFE